MVCHANTELTQHNNAGYSFINFDKTVFSIIPVIANSVKAGDIIKIYGIRSDSENTDIWEKKLLSELNSLLIEKDFDYEYEPVCISDLSDISASMELFNTLVSTVENGDWVYADMTSAETAIPMTMMMFMNYLMMYQKDTVVEAAVYGMADNNELVYALYDVTKLVYANNVMSHADASADSKNILNAILSYGKENIDTEEKSIVTSFNKEEYTEEKLSEVQYSENDYNCSDDTESVDSVDRKMQIKHRIGSSSRFKRSVGKFYSPVQIVFNGKILNKPNKRVY